MQPIILFSTGRSGSTIFTEAFIRNPELAFPSSLLARWPQYSFLNFARHLFDNPLYQYLGTKEQRVKFKWLNKFSFKFDEAYPVWHYLLAPEHDFSRSFLLQETPSPKTIARVNTYFNLMVRFQSKSRLALKVTGPSRLYFLSHLFPEAKYIGMKRSFLHTVHSFLNVSFWKNRSTGELWWRGAYSAKELDTYELIKNNPVLSTAFQINKILEVSDREVESLKLPVHLMNYEAFCENPAGVLKGAFDHCELDFDQKPFEFLKRVNISNRNHNILKYFKETDLIAIEELTGHKIV